MPYVLPALNVTCQQKVKIESYEDSKIQTQTCRWNYYLFLDHLQVLVYSFKPFHIIP